ncbi:MAG: DNA adenine methylase [Candidimonas sp.]
MASFIRYPGGKKKFLKIIKSKISELGKNCTNYREPFFGGGSVGLDILDNSDDDFDLLPKFKSFWINDKDVAMYALWLSVRDHHDSLKELVNSFIPSIEAYDEFKQYLLSLNDNTEINITETAFKKIAIHQISYSGLGTKSGGPLGGRKQDENTKYPINCRWSPSYICKKIDHYHKKFNDIEVKITNTDFDEIITTNSSNTFIYLDPPYYDKGGELYQHAFTVEDHERLSELLKATNHKWLLSYDDMPEIRQLYSWAEITEISANYSINGSQRKQELLIWPK